MVAHRDKNWQTLGECGRTRKPGGRYGDYFGVVNRGMPYERVPLVRDQGDAQDTPPNAREADSFEARASLVRVSWLLEGASKENLFFMKRPSAWVSCYTSEKLEPTLPLSSPSPNKPDSESPKWV